MTIERIVDAIQHDTLTTKERAEICALLLGLDSLIESAHNHGVDPAILPALDATRYEDVRELWHRFTTAIGEAPLRSDDGVAAMVARTDRTDTNPPHEVQMLSSLDELHQWASERGVIVYLVSTDADGRHLYAAHSGPQSRVARGPHRQRRWRIHGFQT